MPTSPKHIILRLTNEGIYLNDHLCLPWSQTDWPAREHFTLKTHYVIYWEVRLSLYDRSSGTLTVEPVDYHIQQAEEWAGQQPKAPVRQLRFRSIDWAQAKDHFAHYRAEAFVNESAGQSLDSEQEVADSPAANVYYGTLPAKERLPIEFRYPLKKVIFGMGYADMRKKWPGFAYPLHIRIENSAILPAFNYIKPYFAKVLGKQTVGVKGWVALRQNRVVAMQFQSADILAINEDTIATVRQTVVQQAIQGLPSFKPDQQLFTSDDLFDGYQEDKRGDMAAFSEEELLRGLFDFANVRNRQQLDYLAGSLHDTGERVRFTLSPAFGFLFTVRGERQNHFIWELLDSHATYLWSMERTTATPASQLHQIERVIGFIREHGRAVYLRHADDDLVFHRIVHENTHLQDGFPKWKARLLEKIS